MKINKNKGTKRLIIENVPDPQEAAQREVVVGEVGTVAFEVLAAAPFAIHIAMQ